MLIDDKGKLFGKINIIDLTIIFIIIGMAFGAWYKFGMSKDKVFGNQETSLQFQFYKEEVPDFIASSIKPGDIVIEPIQNIEFGRVKEVKVDKAISWDNTPKGETKPFSKPGYSSICLTVEGKGIFTDRGVKIGVGMYFIGKEYEIRVGNSALYPRISDIKKK